MKTTVLTMLILAGSALMANADPIRFCTGSESGNYTFAANEIVKRLPDEVKSQIEVVFTKGSLDNLNRITDGGCDVAFAQGDVASMFLVSNPNARNRIMPFKRVYDEYVHLLCPVASGWDEMSDLSGKTAKVIVGPEGTGSAETWRSIYNGNEAYAKIERLPNPVGIASVSMVKDSVNTCMLWVSGLNSPDMQSANAISFSIKSGYPAMHLVSINDKAMDKAIGLDGAPLYTSVLISPVAPDLAKKNPGFYYNLIDSGSFSSSVDMKTVPAWLYVTQAVSEQSNVMNALTKAVEDASPTIWNAVNQQ